MFSETGDCTGIVLHKYWCSRIHMKSVVVEEFKNNNSLSSVVYCVSCVVYCVSTVVYCVPIVVYCVSSVVYCVSSVV